MSEQKRNLLSLASDINNVKKSKPKQTSLFSNNNMINYGVILLDKYSRNREQTNNVLVKIKEQIDFSNYVKQKQKIQTTIQSFNPNNDNLLVESLELVSEIYDTTSGYQNQQASYYTNNLNQSLNNSLIELVDNTDEIDANETNAVAMVQSTIYNNFTTIESQINNDLNLSQDEKNNIIFNFTLIRSLILSNDFSQIITNLINDNNFASAGNTTASFGSFLKSVVRVVVAAAIVVAGTFLGAAIGHFIEEPTGMFALGGLLMGVHYAGLWLEETSFW